MVRGACVASIDVRQRATVEIADHHFVALIRECDPPAGRCGPHRHDVSYIPGERAGPPIFDYLDALFAGSVADGYDGLAIVQPLSVSKSAIAIVTVLPNRSLPQRKREEFSASVESHAVAFGVYVDGPEVVGGRHEPARCLRTM